MNALEIFASKVNERLVTSGNVDCEQSYTKVFTEAIPTCTDQRQSVELYKTYYLADAHLSGLTGAVKQWMRQASWRLAAQKPTEKLDCPVIFGAQELYEMLAAIVSDSDFATVYSGSNRFSLGDSIADGDCPAYSDAQRPHRRLHGQQTVRRRPSDLPRRHRDTKGKGDGLSRLKPFCCSISE